MKGMFFLKLISLHLPDYLLFFVKSYLKVRRLRLKCDGTRAENRSRFSAKRTSPFKSAGGVSSID
jgi:hypothetical protein